MGMQTTVTVQISFEVTITDSWGKLTSLEQVHSQAMVGADHKLRTGNHECVRELSRVVTSVTMRASK